MKVGNKINPSVENLKNNSTDKLNLKSNNAPTSDADKASQIKDSSHVNLSSRAQMMNKAKQIASEQTVDEAKVAHLQKLIDEGKYHVDAADIADKLVDEHLATFE